MSGSLSRAEFDRINEGVTGLETGSQVPNTPRWKIHSGISYAGDGPFFASMDVTSREETTWHLPFRQPIVNDKRTLVNARVGWRLDGLEVSVWGRNITNERYFDERDFAQPFAYVGDPRELGLSVTMRW